MNPDVLWYCFLRIELTKKYPVMSFIFHIHYGMLDLKICAFGIDGHMVVLTEEDSDFEEVPDMPAQPAPSKVTPKKGLYSCHT